MGEKSNEIDEGTAGTAQAPAATGGRVTETRLAPGVESELTGASSRTGPAQGLGPSQTAILNPTAGGTEGLDPSQTQILNPPAGGSPAPGGDSDSSDNPIEELIDAIEDAATGKKDGDDHH
jgi:hypothetical protein